jgi:CRP/FNR family transcriptional regulator
MATESHVSRYFHFDELPQSLSDAGVEKSFAKGAIILRPDDKPEGFYAIVQGSVSSYHLDRAGVVKNVVYMEKNSIFFEKDVMLDTRVPYFFRAEEDSVLLFVSSDKLTHLLATDLEATRFIAYSLAQKMHLFLQNYDGLQYYDSMYRTCSTLIDLSKRFGVESKGGLKLNTRLSQQHLAELSGISRVTIVKNIGCLKDEGLIEKINDFYYIPNMPNLINYMERFI